MVRKLIINRPEPDIFTLNCPTQQVLDIICNKWSVIVIYCLAYKIRRYKQLERKIEGISQKVLTQTLRKLESNGLVNRQVYPVVPPQVEYSLTPLGETLIEPLASLAEGREQNMAEIEKYRESSQFFMKDIGALGEMLVARWLELHDYDLLQQNWRCRWGEIDLIARERKEQTVVFVEVKTRSQISWDEGGLLAVDFSKQEKIIKTASMFLAKYAQLAESPCRFDVALVGYRECLSQRRRGAEEERSEKLKDLLELEIGQPLRLKTCKLTINDYIQSAFEL